ncbi:prolipoprotein diacylglyceryl transferase [Globicatella sulfidifaciens]|uniref:Phosphatidylglycerol--prolipoprotein diacylglyceryl transferase n=1 Tax=Globicatella sulfidifaciens DSM 15739 TaxID=1121925 RepID=A0A1T4MNN5_9LACT|nr:prolipoprotein diacylglyceryl transferase [Globicatella sulfidifaciens]SJZ68426.1 Prolipoprotein diacylglyceryl transferase [Globicatella sulfidifaciens DSM 15739]
MNVLFSVIDPVAISFGTIEIYWYGIIIALAMLLGISLATKEAQKMGLEEDTMTDMALWAIPIGFIGARLYYVLFKWEYYLQNPNEIIAIWNGGIAIYGGLIAGGLAVYWFARRKKMPLTLLLDIVAPSVLLAQSIGRWGNFINQEAHGGPVTRQFLENLYLPEFIINQMNINGTYYHPTFLYESLWSLVGFALLLLLRNKNQFLRQGEVALSYVIWYSAGRFFIEGMRTDSLWIGDFLRVSQGLSLVLFVAALGVLMYRRYYTYPLVPYYKDEPKLL